jgi:hypothetical protein
MLGKVHGQTVYQQQQLGNETVTPGVIDGLPLTAHTTVVGPFTTTDGLVGDQPFHVDTSTTAQNPPP